MMSVAERAAPVSTAQRRNEVRVIVRTALESASQNVDDKACRCTAASGSGVL